VKKDDADRVDLRNRSQTSACLSEAYAAIGKVKDLSFGPTSATVPHDWWASRLEMVLGGAPFHQEHFTWLRGNALINLDLKSIGEPLTDAFVVSTIEKTTASLDRVSKSK
jgi:hypothetical protein